MSKMVGNWEAKGEYFDGSGRTFYSYQPIIKQHGYLYGAVYTPWNKELSFATYSMGDHDVLRFIVENLEEAEMIVKHFKNEWRG